MTDSLLKDLRNPNFQNKVLRVVLHPFGWLPPRVRHRIAMRVSKRDIWDRFPNAAHRLYWICNP